MEGESGRGFQHWLRMCFRRLAGLENPEDIEKEIEQLIDEGEQRGLISEDEGEMIQGIFSFRDTIAREIMVPRTEAVSARIETNLRDIIEIIIESGHSRIPVYQDNIDHVIGTLHAKDLLEYWGKNDIVLQDIVRPPYFIPETKKISQVLKELQVNKSHMAIVIDEYGGTAGILTLEDIIEEIIGEIVDEYDADEQLIIQHEDGSITVNARLDVEELQDHLKVELPEGRFESVGGFVINLLGKMPDVNEKVVFKNLEMEVEAASSLKIEKIRIRKIDSETAEGGPAEEVPS